MVWISEMAGRPLKDITLAKNLEELQKLATIDKVQSTPAKLLLNSSNQLLKKAEEHHLDGDEEHAYVYYFRFIDAVSTASKRDEFKKEKDFFEKLVPRKTLKDAIVNLEKLSASLEKRYKLKEEIDSIESAAKLKEFKEASENFPKTNKSGKLSTIEEIPKPLSSLNGVIKSNGVESKTSIVQNGGIDPRQLKSLLDQKTKRVLLVDCRDQMDFSKNHIQHSHCVCIPARALTPGMTAGAILNILKECSPESYMDWEKRDTFDHIILYDWNSSIENRQMGLNLVYDALTKWDPNNKNRAEIQVIQGGMKNMYYTYPFMLTNPQTAANNANKPNGVWNTVEDAKKLDSISYPDLDPKPQKPPVANHSVPNFIPSNSNNYPSEPSHDNVPNMNGVNNSGIKIDRSTKPSRYSSNQKIPNGDDSSVSTTGSGTQSVEISSSLEKTDIKVKEYSQALDAVIESSRNAVKNEEEITELRDKVNKNPDEAIVAALKKHEEMETILKKELEKSNNEMTRMKAQYEALLRDQKSTLPKIRKSAEEIAIDAKEKERVRIYEEMNRMRRLRLQKEAEEKEKRIQDEEEGRQKLPPLASNTTTGPPSKVNSGTNATRLPSISNNANGPSTTPSSSTIIPGVQPSSSSRPISQDSSAITKQKLKDESDHPRSSSLKRSHSHPNIAQSHDDDMGDDLPASSQIPQINRRTKPTSHRAPEIATTPRRCARNFEVVVSSSETSKTGLKNLGNTCYMNSIIQCLSHTVKLVEYLRKEEYQKEWHPHRCPTKGEATEEVAAAVKQMHSGHRSISLLDLKSAVGRHHRSFRGFEQQDSHEFITILLDWMHEEMNRVSEKSPLKEQKNDGLTDEIAASRHWEDYKKSNNSKISELFCGQQKSCVTCGSCNRQSVTFETFFILSVPIPSPGKRCDIQQCIELYTAEEALQDWNCVHCKRKVRATKKIDLWRLPPYLIIHLQRFYNDGYWKKRLTEIDFPVENLNLNQRVLKKPDPTERPCSYDYQLYGVSNHYGSMDGGHYTAYCRANGVNGPSSSWWKFDDQEVCHIMPNNVSTAAAYILFYQNRNC